MESQDERDRRVEKLWEILDSRREGQIDFKGFKKGLKQMDHRTLFSFRLYSPEVKKTDTASVRLIPGQLSRTRMVY